MTKREVVRKTLLHDRPPYVPWACGFTVEAKQKLVEHFGSRDLEEALQNHILILGSEIGFFEDIGPDVVRDVFGVVWDRSIDKDIGNIRGTALPEPTMHGYTFPDPLEQRFFKDIPNRIDQYGDRFRVYSLGFSLYERAWTLRGMENLLMDMVLHPDFVHDLLNRIADYNIAQVHEALTYDIDGVYFGDDWGQQHGLIMGPDLWYEFFYPVLRRMYGEIRRAGKFVMIHSCGDVDELFDNLIEIGLNCFNPFQPEVMDVFDILQRYGGKLAFHGGLSTQRTLPYGTVFDVQHETTRLLEAGREGGYIFAPAHDVEGDVPLENILAFLETVQTQPGFG
jgi:uroporphyrinogen decarboxylase